MNLPVSFCEPSGIVLRTFRYRYSRGSHRKWDNSYSQKMLCSRGSHIMLRIFLVMVVSTRDIRSLVCLSSHTNHGDLNEYYSGCITFSISSGSLPHCSSHHRHSTRATKHTRMADEFDDVDVFGFGYGMDDDKGEDPFGHGGGLDAEVCT